MFPDDNDRLLAGKLSRNPEDGTVPMNSDGTVPEPWPNPIPLRSNIQPPAYPVDALPKSIRAWALANAEELQCPVDLPASLALGALSCACGGWLAVQVRELWIEPTNLYLAIALRSGEAKTPAFNRAVKAIRDFEQEEAVRLQPAITQLETERIYHEERVHALKLKLRKNKHEDHELLKAELAEHKLDLKRIPIVQSPRYLADDITQEQLGVLMSANAERMGLFSDEGGLFRLMAGYYNDGKANLDIYLKAFSAESVTVDRVSREAISLRRPSLTICLAVQPSVIQKLGETPEMRGHGLLARFLLVIPESRVGYRNLDPTVASQGVLAAYDDLIRRLLLRGQLGGNFQPPEKHLIKLTREGHKVIIRAQEQIEPRLAPGGDLFGYADWMNKSAGRIARISGLLHFVLGLESDDHSEQVSVNTVKSAKRLHDYYLDHAVMGLDLLGADPVISSAEFLLAWIKKRGLERFTKREAMVGCRSQFKRAAHMNEPLAMLEENGWIRKAPAIAGKPGRPSETYLVHPAQNSQKAQYLGQDDHSVDSVGFVQESVDDKDLPGGRQ